MDSQSFSGNDLVNASASPPVSDPDVSWMRLALDQARLAEGFVEPNPMVGSVIVKDQRAIGIGYHARYGSHHAEVDALNRTSEDPRGATLYVTLEPCCHYGKTPPCTDAILQAGIRRVVAATRDPFPKVDGGGIATLIAHGVEVRTGVEAESAIRMNAPYFKKVLTGRPFVIAKWAMTLDGKTAVRTRDSRWISGPESRALVHETRGKMDGVVVGIETALADDPSLTARPAGPRTPARIILDSSARLPLGSRLATTARETPVIVVVTDQAPQNRREALSNLGCEVLVLPRISGSEHSRISILGLLDVLGEKGMTNLLVEGGSRVLGSFWEADQVDRVDVFVAPKIEGGDHPYTAIRGIGCDLMSQSASLEQVTFQQTGIDILIRADVPQAWRSQLGEALDLKQH